DKDIRAVAASRDAIFMQSDYMCVPPHQRGIAPVDFGAILSMFRASYFKRLSPSQR
ncbi:MAG: hypothetical protein ACJAVC_001074, partial [Brevundimonas sp.]